MFQKQTFGGTTAGFGTSTTPSFGSFKPTTATNAFGAPPAFGASATAQPATGGGLFGSANTSGGLFGGSTTATSAPAFGSTSGGFGFAANTSTGGLFGNNQSTGLFGNTQNNSAFGAKPAGFGFGNTSATGTTGTGLFGSTPSTSTGLFGQQNTSLGGGGLFANTGGAFGQQQAPTGTGHVKYNPVVGTDVVMKAGASQNVNIKHHCITCMKEYEGKSLEELRLEDYTAGRKGASGGMFSGFQQPTENKPLFGGTSFGQPATTSAPLFGGGSLGTSGFGQTNTFSFGGNTQNQTTSTGLFGNKPAFGATSTAGTGIFGGTATTQAPTFGTTTPSFGGFGASTQNQSTGLFGAKPATTGFGSTPASSGFGGFGSGLFNAKPQQTTAPTFGTAAPSAFGTLSSGFGTNTSSSGFFGSLAKPNTTPLLGQTQNTGFGAGLGTGLGTSFQTKPAAAPFSNLGAGCIFHQQQPANTFRTGLDSGLGNSMFSNAPSLGAGLSLGGFNANTTAPPTGASAAGSGVHEQILTLAARPYGDSPLFKDLLPDSATPAEEALKPTNPAALKAALDSAYKVASPSSGRLRVIPRPSVPHDKKSLFDGLEESDASLEDKLSLKPSRKRLVLRSRPNDTLDSNEHSTNINRSLEQQTSQTEVQNERPEATNPASNAGQPLNATHVSHDAHDAPHRGNTDQRNMDNNRSDVNSDKHGNWLSGSKVSWADKEKPLDGETPRLYPNLDKELSQGTDRRASWLTTKPLRKPLASNPDAAESSVRELAIRPERSSLDKENVDSGSDAPVGEQLNFCCHRWGQQPGCTRCEKIAHQIGGLYVSEEENVIENDAPPHPAGIKLRRPGYYTIPSLEELVDFIRPDGSCVVPHFTVGRKNYGNVFYDCEVDVANLDLDALVHFLNKEVIIYPEDAEKPPVGQGLNRRAVVTLDRVWPRDKTQRRLIVEPDRLLKMDYEGKLRRVCEKHDTKFIEYRPQTGSWVFRVEHFSKYGLTDSDEEDDPTPDVLKRQLANQSLQKSAAPAATQPAAVQSAGLGAWAGWGRWADWGRWGARRAAPTSSVAEDLFSLQRTSLDLLNGAEKAFEMDTTEDSTEAPTLYPDSLAFGVKSPTSELARLEHRQSHNVQLMKASLYADIADVEEDASESTGDQLVPLGLPGRESSPSSAERLSRLSRHDDDTVAPQPAAEEAVMRPLIVRPQSVVLKYHRKVPPFKETIAGRLGASWLADMSVCRARHSRVGFAAASTLAYVTTFDSVSDLPRSAGVSELGRYVGGRAAEDWSAPLLVRLAVGRDAHAQDALPQQLESLLEFSRFVEEGECPRLQLAEEPALRHQLLQQLLRHAESQTSNSYHLQVWKLCEALWGADLDNDGVPGTDVQSIVHRHRQLLSWLQEAVADVTQQELKMPTAAEAIDESDGHSGRVWTLLLGGRLLEACKVARDNGDLHMATLLAQAAGDPTFRSLIARQLHVWQECGAHDLVAQPRLAALHLLAGLRPRGELEKLDWLRAFHATARYLCPQVPQLEQIVRSYVGCFRSSQQTDCTDEELELSSVPEDEMGMKLPLPPYCNQYDCSVTGESKRRRVLDLRYELLRARALNCRPKLQPAAYTADPLDYSLCFLVGVWLGNPTVDSITGVADQLEARGQWHLAVQALAYLPDSVMRGHLIRGVVSRHAPCGESGESGERLQLLRRLRLPARWLLLAQAHRAKYEHKPMLEAEYLVGAEQWNAAHRVLVDELWADAVLADNIQSIRPLLERLNEAAERHEVSGWESGGKALYHYMYVCDEVRGLVAAAEGEGEGEAPRGAAPGLHSRLEALRPRLAAACSALERLTPRNGRQAAARAEMGARLVQLALAGGEPPRHLAALLRALQLPPDCTAHAHHKITTDLAEQASELCIDSPLSSHSRSLSLSLSHRRPAVHS